MSDTQQQPNWTGPIVFVAIVAVAIFAWRGGLDGWLPEDSAKTDESVATQALESRDEYTAAEAANLRQVAKGLRRGEFKRVKDGVAKLNKLNNDDGAKAWAAFGKAMQKFDKADELKDAADYMDATADGLERHSGK